MGRGGLGRSPKSHQHSSISEQFLPSSPWSRGDLAKESWEPPTHCSLPELSRRHQASFVLKSRLLLSQVAVLSALVTSLCTGGREKWKLKIKCKLNAHSNLPARSLAVWSCHSLPRAYTFVKVQEYPRKSNKCALWNEINSSLSDLDILTACFILPSCPTSVHSVASQDLLPVRALWELTWKPDSQWGCWSHWAVLVSERVPGVEMSTERAPCFIKLSKHVLSLMARKGWLLRAHGYLRTGKSHHFDWKTNSFTLPLTCPHQFLREWEDITALMRIIE